jgi:uncharacterized protein (UPF0335 family)
LEKSPVIKNFGDFILANRFDIQITYLVVQESKKFFTTGIAMPERMMIVTVAYCKYINQYDIPEEVFELLSYNKVKIEGIATRFFEEYAGKEQPRIITWMKTYGRPFKYSPEVIKMAIELWDAADPIYVVAEDQVRAVVWLELTKHKMEKTKINMAALARATGFDSRVISRVVKKYKVYVKNEKGNVVKVEFGDPNMEIKRDDPARLKSFRARHNCKTATDKFTARYWSCKKW